MIVTHRRLRATAIVLAIVASAPEIAVSTHAQTLQPELRREASFTVGASFGDGNTALASTADLRFGLTSRFGIAFELAHARKLDFTLDLCPPPLVCIRGGRLPVTGRTVSLVPHVTVDLLPRSHRLRLYLRAGVGAGHVRQRWFDGLPSTNRVELTRSHLTAALSVGGGAAVQLSGRVAVGVEVTSLHLFDDEARLERFITPGGTLSTLRVGVRLGWHF